MEPERSTAIVRKARDSALILNQKNPPHDNTHCVFDINISSIHKTSRCPLRKVLPTLIVYILHTSLIRNLCCAHLIPLLNITYIRFMSTGLEHLLADSCTAAFIKVKRRIKISDRGR